MPQIQSLFKDLPYVGQAMLVVAVLLLAILSYMTVRRFLLRVIYFAIKRTRNDWDDVLVERRVFDCLALLAPVVVIYWGREILPFNHMLLERFLRALAVGILILASDRFLSALLDIYNTFPIARKWPLKGYVQVLKIFLYVCGLILVVCILIDQSPWGLLSGIGAITAVLLFVFRDTILSLIASIQIVANDLVRVGDWIEMPQYGADGDVIEIALHTVKVQNCDNTITTIPTYMLVEGSLTN